MFWVVWVGVRSEIVFTSYRPQPVSCIFILGYFRHDIINPLLGEPYASFSLADFSSVNFASFFGQIRQRFFVIFGPNGQSDQTKFPFLTCSVCSFFFQCDLSPHRWRQSDQLVLINFTLVCVTWFAVWRNRLFAIQQVSRNRLIASWF